jgi:hypothetical protein
VEKIWRERLSQKESGPGNAAGAALQTALPNARRAIRIQ